MRHPRPHLGRRAALLAGTSLCAALIGPLCAHAQPPVTPAPITPARFLAMSARLCGVPLADQALAGEILAALLAMPDMPALELANLAALVEHVPEGTLTTAIPGAGLERVAERIVATWYSGMVGEPGQQRVLSFTGAAAWLAVGYPAKPTECVGFGAWATRP